MSEEILVRVDGVSKKFCRSLKRSLWYGIKDTLADLAGGIGSPDKLRTAEFWAVDKVSFELRRGECLGLIGRNGAGKTTLLKMLNGLIKPDGGRIELHGRIAALIALGAGFNPILTGRENIYVNGSVLGLSRKDIDRKLDDIIDFAEIEEFIDSPVQSYSSGMQVRLGFAVATAIEPDVLLLDEVLAVGDAAFQAKCYRRIGLVLEKAAVILVSHNAYHIQRICNEAILLEHGRTSAVGLPAEVLQIYASSSNAVVAEKPSSILDDTVSCAKVTKATPRLDYGSNLELTLVINSMEPIECNQAYLNIVDPPGNIHAQVILDGLVRKFEGKRNEIHITIGPLYISGGKYQGSLLLLTSGGKKILAGLRNCFSFEMSGPLRLGAAVYFPPSRVEVQQNDTTA